MAVVGVVVATTKWEVLLYVWTIVPHARSHTTIPTLLSLRSGIHFGSHLFRESSGARGDPITPQQILKYAAG